MSYVRNDHLEFVIPYEWKNLPLSYVPDFIVRLSDETTLVLEVKGHEREQDREKHVAARRWRDAVNNWGKLGKWRFEVSRDPHSLCSQIQQWMAETP